MRLLQYFKTLEILKYYFSLTSYLQSYIYFYAQLASFFSILKTSFLKDILENSY